MYLVKFIEKVVQARIEAGENSDVTPDEAVDLYKRTGEVVREAEWQFVKPYPNRFYIFTLRHTLCGVPEDFTLKELYDNLKYAIDNKRAVTLWNQQKMVDLT